MRRMTRHSTSTPTLGNRSTCMLTACGISPIKVEKADLESVQFHMNRGDFEAWFIGLGDADLAKKVAALKEKNVAGEDLRSQLHEIVEQRYIRAS